MERLPVSQVRKRERREEEESTWTVPFPGKARARLGLSGVTGKDRRARCSWGTREWGAVGQQAGSELCYVPGVWGSLCGEDNAVLTPRARGLPGDVHAQAGLDVRAGHPATPDRSSFHSHTRSFIASMPVDRGRVRTLRSGFRDSREWRGHLPAGWGDRQKRPAVQCSGRKEQRNVVGRTGERAGDLGAEPGRKRWRHRGPFQEQTKGRQVTESERLAPGRC